MLQAQDIVARAAEIAKTGGTQGGVPVGMFLQAGQLLNAILRDLGETYDFAVARGLYNFNFNPGLTTQFGSGPYPMPMDYLRTSGSSGSSGAQHSVFWTLLGVPYPLIPCDLAEFDMQIQQAGLQSYPWLFATDMAARRVILATTGDTNGTTAVVNLASNADLAVGLSVAGDTIAPGTVVTALPSPTSATLSLPTTAGEVGASLYFGNPGVAYVYPPPSGAYPVTVRYQRDMPPIVAPEASADIPWFPNEGYLIKELAGRLMMLSDDARHQSYVSDAEGSGGSGEMLRKYLKMKDDSTNRPQQVQLDRRSFGSSFTKLPNTKTIGW